ncbi:MAG: aldehyde dehydrogenase, partial [Bdellovibrio sp.]
MEIIKNFIKGEYVAPQSERYMDSFNPATGQVAVQIPDSQEVDVVMAVKAAKEAFPGWSQTSMWERAQILNRISDLLEKRAEEFAQIESEDVGKPLWLAREVDIPRTIANFRFFASKILTREERCSEMDQVAINYTLRQPVGVCGLIAPWNLPLYLMTWKLAPCLAMGNTAVCKPSELTSRSTALLGEVLNEAGLPPGVCNIVMGRGETAGAALVQHPSVPVISFTGGTQTGAHIQQMAAPFFKKVSLELGGKNANIVFKDADMEKALEGTLRAGFLNSGQICLCGSRLLVQQDIYEEFVGRLKERVQALKVGDPKEEDTFLGPVVSQEHQSKILSCIKKAQEDGGKVTVGGGKVQNLKEDLKGGYFVEPTVIEDLSFCSDIWQTEIFGPVITVAPFKYQKDAVKLANTSSYGLSASLWTKDIQRAHRVARELEAGTVWINTWMKRDLRVPFGGMKDSGVGREGGEYSLDIYSELKNVCVS